MKNLSTFPMKSFRSFVLTIVVTTLLFEKTSAQSVENQLSQARSYETAGQVAKAKDAYRAIWKGQPKSPEAPAALLAHARLEEAANDYLAAYRNLERLVDKYPNSKDFNAALEGMFRIASKFLEGEKLKLLGVPSIPSMGKAAEMFDKIVAVGPFNPIAPAAQFNAGLAYEKARRYPEAIAAYQKVSDNYPGSEYAPDALYQSAYVLMLQTKAAAYDQTTTKKALNAFQEFVITYPNHPKTPQALKNISDLGNRLVKGALSIAEFYEAHGNISAAIASYEKVVDDNPGTEEARLATERLAVLRQKHSEESSGNQKRIIRPSDLVPKLPKIRLPFSGQKDGENVKEAVSQPEERIEKRSKKEGSSKKQSPSVGTLDRDHTAQNFADPGPKIRADTKKALNPIPAPSASPEVKPQQR